MIKTMEELGEELCNHCLLEESDRGTKSYGGEPSYCHESNYCDLAYDTYLDLIKNGICPACDNQMTKTINENWYCEDCDEYF